MKDVNLLISNGVNVQKSLELFGDMATYDETLETFINDIEGRLADIRKYKEIADMANYAILVHSLKSDAKYFGFDQLSELAAQHEAESKANNIYYVYDNYELLMLEASKIVKLVNQYFGRSTEQTQPAQQVVAETPKDINILVVDDSKIISNFIVKLFDDVYGVLVASDGAKAIELLNTASENKIRAMLLDLNMPNVNGMQVLEYMKVNNLFDKVAVSIITGEGSMEAIGTAFQYPIVDVIRKPFNERDIKSILERTLAVKDNI
jgi:Response regulator containing CheY-like receiver, AAA-type ATPase, and DNA-binding domains